MRMADTRVQKNRGAIEDDVLVRRRNGEFCELSSLTGQHAVIVIGESVHDLGALFELSGPPGDGSALIVGIQRLEPGAAGERVEVVFDDAHAAPQLLESPSIPVAYVVRGLTPLGPAAVGARAIELLLQGLSARRLPRHSGAISLDDLT